MQKQLAECNKETAINMEADFIDLGGYIGEWPLPEDVNPKDISSAAKTVDFQKTLSGKLQQDFKAGDFAVAFTLNGVSKNLVEDDTDDQLLAMGFADLLQMPILEKFQNETQLMSAVEILTENKTYEALEQPRITEHVVEISYTNS